MTSESICFAELQSFTLLDCQLHVCQVHIGGLSTTLCQIAHVHFTMWIACLNGWLLQFRVLQRFGGAGAEFRVERDLVNDPHLRTSPWFALQVSPNDGINKVSEKVV
jgi:hypothetical protein